MQQQNPLYGNHALSSFLNLQETKHVFGHRQSPLQKYHLFSQSLYKIKLQYVIAMTTVSLRGVKFQKTVSQ
jgi:hypothetical protein